MAIDVTKQTGFVPLTDATGMRSTKQTGFVPMFLTPKVEVTKQTAFLVFFDKPPNNRRRFMPIIN